MTRKLDRREFIRRAAGAGITAVAAGSAAFGLSSGDLPDRRRQNDAAGRPVFPDWSVHDDGPRLAVTRGENRTETFNRALIAMGGIGRFIKPGDVVMVKPNAGFAVPADYCATADPTLVGEIVRLCVAAGATEVRVTDNPVNDPAETFRITGIRDAVEKAGGHVMVPGPESFSRRTVPGARLLVDWDILTTPFEGCNKVIGVCPVKHHGSSGATMTMKNWYGLLSGRRNIFHQRVHEVIAELAMMVTPTLVVLDGTWSMVRNGPTGGSFQDLEHTKTMILSTDQVAADTFGASLLGKTPADLAFLKIAEKLGIGTTDIASLRPVIETAFDGV